MIPLKDNIKTASFPIITVSIIFVNIASYLWTLSFVPSQRQELFRALGLVPYDVVVSFSQRPEFIPYTLFTVLSSMFLHGNLFHVGGNMLYLWIFGNNVEDMLGHRRFVGFYLASGAFSALFQFLYDPLSTLPMIGASGAVSGVLGAYLVLFPYARVMTLLFIFIFIKIVELPAAVFLTLWFFMQVLLSHTEGVAWFAHIGGFIFGMVSVNFLTRRRGRRFT